MPFPERIVALGDSVTYGEGLAENETYTYILQRRLREKLKRDDIIVINAGVSGNIAHQGLERLSRDVLELNPDLVLVSFGLNDGYLVQPEKQEGMAKNLLILIGKVDRKLHRLIPAYRRLCKAKWLEKLRRVVKSGFKGELLGVENLRLKPRVPIDQFKDTLHTIISRIEENSEAEIFLMTTSTVKEGAFIGRKDRDTLLDQIQIYELYNQAIREVAGKSNLGLIDINEEFSKRAEEDLIHPDGIHPTAYGQRVIAEKISEVLSNKYLLPKSK